MASGPYPSIIGVRGGGGGIFLVLKYFCKIIKFTILLIYTSFISLFRPLGCVEYRGNIKFVGEHIGDIREKLHFQCRENVRISSVDHFQPALSL